MRKAVGCWCISPPYHSNTEHVCEPTCTQTHTEVITYLQPYTTPAVQKVIT